MRPAHPRRVSRPRPTPGAPPPPLPRRRFLSAARPCRRTLVRGRPRGARKVPIRHLPCALALVSAAQPSARLPRSFRAPCAKKRRKNGPLRGAVEPSGVAALRLRRVGVPLCAERPIAAPSRWRKLGNFRWLSQMATGLAMPPAGPRHAASSGKPAQSALLFRPSRGGKLKNPTPRACFSKCFARKRDFAPKAHGHNGD